MKKLIIAVSILLLNFNNAQVKKNIVKTNLTGYVFRNINLSYERSINKWFSVNVSYGTVPQGKVPFIDSFVDDDDENNLKNIELSNSAFTIEPRFYVGAGYGKGFYLAPYYRNTQTKVDNYVYNYEFDNGIVSEVIPMNVSGKATGNSFGLMIGAQWFLGKKDNWVLDFWIAGAHYGKGKGEFIGKTVKSINADQQQQLQNDLEDLGLPIIEYTVTTNSDGAKINLDGPWAGLRSGLSFGYRF